MNTELVLHNRTVSTVFELLGTRENDITYSLGWALAKCPTFRAALVNEVFPGQQTNLDINRVSLQGWRGKEGITDVELLGKNVHIVIEAKRGWEVPTREQLCLYTKRLRDEGRKHCALLAMSECAPDFADINIEKEVDGFRVHHLGWREVERLARVKQGTHAEKRLLAELRAYLRRIVKMQNQESNLVYVVSLGSDFPESSTISWIDIVEKRRRYFHTVGVAGWPKEPPNYLGFRYDGRLQSIYHVEACKRVTDLRDDLPEVKCNLDGQNFLYTLGAAIIPSKVVKTGKIYPSGRVWAMLDLLLTCDTISEARDQTDKRLEE